MELQVLQARLGFTAIYVTHDQAEAFALAETVVVMNRGKIETVGPPREVFHRPATPFVARFLGFNVLQGRVVGHNAQDGGNSSEPRAVRVALGEGLILSGCSQRRLRRSRMVRASSSASGESAYPFASPRRRRPLQQLPQQRRLPDRQVFAGEIRAASFLGLSEEYIVAAERRGAARHSTIQRRAIRRSRRGFHQAAGLHRIPCTDQSLE